MNTTETIEVAELVRLVRAWPAPMRIVLARQILETLEGGVATPASSKLPRGPSSAEIASIFKTDNAVPDDATVKQWIADHRMDKYGK